MQSQTFELQDDQDESDEQDLDEFEIECMLYSQLHHDQTNDTHISEDDHTQLFNSNGLDVNIETFHKNDTISDKPSTTGSSTSVSNLLGLPVCAIQHMIYRNKNDGSSSASLANKRKPRKRKLKSVSQNNDSDDTEGISLFSHGKREKTKENREAMENTIVISSDCSSSDHAKRSKPYKNSSHDYILIDSDSSVDDTKMRSYYGEKVVVEMDSVLEPNTSVISLSSSESDSWDDMTSSDTNSSTDVPHIQVNFRQGSLTQRIKDGEGHDPDKWKINQQDRLGNVGGMSRGQGSLGGRFGGAGLGGRYYRPSSVKCLNCNEVGHLSKDCPRPKKSQICIFCGYTGHFYRNCPQSLCYNCNQPGHTARQCEAPRQKLHWKCFRCDMFGHSHENCTDHWRQFHLTTSVKQLCPSRGQSDVTNKRRYCYNCGSRKHYGFECEKSRIDSHSMATYPLVARYDKRKVLKPLMIGAHRESANFPAAAENLTKLKKNKLQKLTSTKSLEYHSVKLKSSNMNSARTFISRKVSALVPEEWRTAKSAKKNKNSGRKKKFEGSYTSFSDIGKPVKMGKKKKKKTEKWRNKQTPELPSTMSPNRCGFRLSKAVRAKMMKGNR
ncbi:zinc finger CCHC domain-containing protein 7-like [Haliotis asinina]|uniref:zinc finger CCHC domain-containing protein 7-like n=1 Tax=Haliotis asinina TaxID=109174 RepID=UPI0035323BC3